MITKSIYSYRVGIKYGVYTRTIIRVSSFHSLSSTRYLLAIGSLCSLLSVSSQRGAETKLETSNTPFGISLWYKQSWKRRQ